VASLDVVGAAPFVEPAEGTGEGEPRGTDGSVAAPQPTSAKPMTPKAKTLRSVLVRTANDARPVDRIMG
jgi:hypothetical protein